MVAALSPDIIPHTKHAMSPWPHNGDQLPAGTFRRAASAHTALVHNIPEPRSETHLDSGCGARAVKLVSNSQCEGWRAGQRRQLTGHTFDHHVQNSKLRTCLAWLGWSVAATSRRSMGHRRVGCPGQAVTEVLEAGSLHARGILALEHPPKVRCKRTCGAFAPLHSPMASS